MLPEARTPAPAGAASPIALHGRADGTARPSPASFDVDRVRGWKPLPPEPSDPGERAEDRGHVGGIRLSATARPPAVFWMRWWTESWSGPLSSVGARQVRSPHDAGPLRSHVRGAPVKATESRFVGSRPIEVCVDADADPDGAGARASVSPEIKASIQPKWRSGNRDHLRGTAGPGDPRTSPGPRGAVRLCGCSQCTRSGALRLVREDRGDPELEKEDVPELMGNALFLMPVVDSP
jgi:hypothetical protein